MLPPIAPVVFEQNPKFKNLYNDLKVGRLNDDGSTKLIKKQRAQDDLKKKLQTASVQRATTLLIQDALLNAGQRLSALPEDLQEVVKIICAQLDGSLSPEDREVVVDDFEHFVERIEQVAEAISASIAEDARHIGTVLAAIDDPSSTTPIAITTFLSRAQALRRFNTTQGNNVSIRSIQLADVSASTAILNRELLQVVVRILEQSMHGTVARATRAQAEHLATVSRGMELKLTIITHNANPAHPLSFTHEDGLGRAAQQYALKLRQSSADAKQDLLNAEAKLRDYEGAGRGMSDIAKRYAELQAEMIAVVEEITRLKEIN